MSEPAHLLVVDDDARLRHLLRKFLSENGYLISTAANAAEARQQLAAMAFDLIVLDVMMPGETGLDLTRSLRGNNDVPILLLTAMGETEDRIKGLDYGADDYLAKPFEPRELLLRINSILRRSRQPEEPVLTPAPFRFGRHSFDRTRHELILDGEVVHLTSADQALLAILAEQPGQTISREELAGRLGAGGNLRSIDVQITRLRRKIEDDPRQPRYLQTVRGLGYVLWSD